MAGTNWSDLRVQQDSSAGRRTLHYSSNTAEERQSTLAEEGLSAESWGRRWEVLHNFGRGHVGDGEEGRKGRTWRMSWVVVGRNGALDDGPSSIPDKTRSAEGSSWSCERAGLHFGRPWTMERGKGGWDLGRHPVVNVAGGGSQ